MTSNNDLAERLRSATAHDPLGPVDTARIAERGERSLRRRRAIGAGSTVAALALTAVTAVTATNGWRSADPRPLPPVAGTSATPAPHPSTTHSEPPIGPVVPRPGSGGVDRLVINVIAQHLDPARKHLRVTGEQFALSSARAMGGRVAWRIPGQDGEGFVGLGLAASPDEIGNRCGSTVPGMTCHEVTLPNGRKAQLGRKGEAVQLYYVQPDGELAYAEVNPLYANNTTIPLHSVGITDAQLFALVQDPRLDLATMRQQEQKEQARFTGFKPSRAELAQAVRRNLTGGTLTEGDFESVTERESLAFVWRAAGVAQDVAVYVYGAAGREPTCLDPAVPQRHAGVEPDLAARADEHEERAVPPAGRRLGRRLRQHPAGGDRGQRHHQAAADRSGHRPAARQVGQAGRPGSYIEYVTGRPSATR